MSRTSEGSFTAPDPTQFNQSSCNCNKHLLKRPPMAPLSRKRSLSLSVTVASAPAWDGTGCELDSWQCRIYITCLLSLRLLWSLRGSLGTYGLTQKLC